MRFGYRLSIRCACWLALACLFLAALPSASAQHSAEWPDIAFARSIAGVFRLYGVMADGSELDSLYSWPDSADRRYPVWAPNRRVVAYARGYEGDLDGHNGVYSLDLTTGEERFLFADAFAYPSQWSPNGSRLLITHEEPAYGQVWCIDADGTDPTLLAGGAESSWDLDPRWLPDGSKVVFVSNPFNPANQHIWSVNPDGTGLTKLTTGTGPYQTPRPSPDGKLIAYVKAANIYTMNPDGSGTAQLTATSRDSLYGESGDPWSPDGAAIAFDRDDGPPDGYQVYRMNRDGTSQVNLSPAWGFDYLPFDWSPDGSRIAFMDAGAELGSMGADGSGAAIIVTEVSSDPTWRASGLRRVSLLSLDIVPDTDITVPVKVDTCLGVAGMQIELTYDPDILQCTSVVKGPLLDSSWAMPTPNIDNTLGNVKFLAYDAGAEPLPAGSGVMFTLSFHVKATAPCCTTSPLHFVKCLISDGWGDPILMAPVDGAVTTIVWNPCDFTIVGSGGSVEVDGEPQTLPYTGTVTTCGTEVWLLAIPDPGYEFVGWSGDLVSTDNPAVLMVDEYKTVTAEFAPTTCSLSILGTNGSAVVDGVPHTLPWSADYTCGSEVSVEAIPAACYVFESWSGDVISTANPTVITVDSDLIATANFGLATYTLNLSGTGSGSVATDGVPRALPWSGSYSCGASVHLEATPADEHWFFDRWSGDLTGTANPSDILMNSPKSVTAGFLAHVLDVTCSAAPDTVYSGGTTQLGSQADDSAGHSAAVRWEDLLDADPDPVPAGGSFGPSADVPNPTYTAPENPGSADVQIILQAAATCDQDPRLSGMGTFSLTVKPCTTMAVTSSEGTRGQTARVPVTLELATSAVDRFSFTAAVTAVAGAPALTGSLGFEAAPGLPAPGLVSPSGNQVSVAWLSPLADPVTGVVALGDILVPVPSAAGPGEVYSVCLTLVGASLGPDEICVEAGQCAELSTCVEILVGDCYRYNPPMADGNSDGDTCDWSEYNDDALTWGDVITTFDAWTIPGIFTCGTGSHRYNAMDSYPRDGEPGLGGDGAITWGDIITTFDRWVGARTVVWRPICWAGELEPALAPRSLASPGRTAAISAVPSLQLADASGQAGGTVRMPVVLELPGDAADRVGFSVEVVPGAAAGDAPVLSGFEAAAGLPSPMTVRTSDRGLAVAWMTPMESSVTGSVALGELVFELPPGVAETASWQVRITAAGASLGESELEAGVSTDDRATITVSPAVPHDVRIARFQTPSSARLGSTKTLTIVVENLTETAESVVVRLRRGGEVIQSWSLDLAGQDHRRLQADYRFGSADIPQVGFTVEVAAVADDHPENNTDSGTVKVR